MGHENKCAHLHGHNYCAELTARASHPGTPVKDLDSIGRVIDFSVLKSTVGQWIEDNLDHGFILHNDDAMALRLMRDFRTDARGSAHQKLYLMACNPTAENIAALIMRVGNMILARYYIELVQVTVHETPNCRATVTKTETCDGEDSTKAD
jgi:6-pyruvoyltetrahydropterin/6-carboxytetrahydropterin synthase